MNSDAQKGVEKTACVFIAFLLLGLRAFGGPAAHIGYFRDEFVHRRHWIDDQTFAQLLALSQFLPGPASSQLGFAIGMQRAGSAGAIAAFIGFTLPSALLLFIFALWLPAFDNEIGYSVIHGLKLVALSVVAHAVISMLRQLCPDTPRRILAFLVALVVLSIHWQGIQLVVILLGAGAGIIFCKGAINNAGIAFAPYSSLTGHLLTAFFFVLLALAFLITQSHPLLTLFAEFYRSGALVFGGGHVVLPLLEQVVVDTGHLDSDTFLAGYGAAQAVPGPLFSIAAYLGANMDTGYAAWLGALLATTAIFLPGFLLLAGLMPLWQRLSHHPYTGGAIAGVNAAVVGLLMAALYQPLWVTAIIQWTDIIIALAGLLLLFSRFRSPLFLILWCVTSSVIMAGL